MKYITIKGEKLPFRIDPVYLEQFEEEHDVNFMDFDVRKVKMSKLLQFIYICIIKGIGTHNKRVEDDDDKIRIQTMEELYEDMDVGDIMEAFGQVTDAMSNKPKKKKSTTG